LIDTSVTATTPSHPPQSRSAAPAASIAPTRMMLEIALVSDISGVCSAGVTFQTTW
jgi:hypothetical protein